MPNASCASITQTLLVVTGIILELHSNKHVSLWHLATQNQLEGIDHNVCHYHVCIMKNTICISLVIWIYPCASHHTYRAGACLSTTLNFSPFLTILLNSTWTLTKVCQTFCYLIFPSSILKLLANVYQKRKKKRNNTGHATKNTSK